MTDIFPYKSKISEIVLDNGQLVDGEHSDTLRNLSPHIILNAIFFPLSLDNFWHLKLEIASTRKVTNTQNVTKYRTDWKSR